MAYPLSILVQLGPAKTDKTLNALLLDIAGDQIGVLITTGFVELADGDYLFSANFPDTFRGAVIIQDSIDDTYLASMAVNPQEYENADAKISTVLTKVSGAVVTVRNPIIESGRIEIARGDDYLVINGRALHFTPDDPDAWPILTVGYPVVLGVGNKDGMIFQGEGTIAVASPIAAQIEISGADTISVGKGHYQFTLRTNGATTETLAEGVLNLHDAWGGY